MVGNLSKPMPAENRSTLFPPMVRPSFNWTSQPIDLYRGNQLAPATPGKPFFVADENEHKTWMFTATQEGTLVQPRLFAQRGEAGVTSDSAGNVYIAEGDIHVYDASGKLIDRIQLPDRPLSLVFCGHDRQTLFITARHSVYAIKRQNGG
jgi:sugar lactone lactonase YvrE